MKNFHVNAGTCKYLLTANMYGKVAWAEAGTDALLKPYNLEHV